MYLYVCFTGGLFAERRGEVGGRAEKKVENEDKCKYQVICLTEGYRRMFL